jgi:C1A family cysteine protease
MHKLCKMTGLFCAKEQYGAEVEQAFVEHVATHGLSFGTKAEYHFRLNEYARKDAAIKKINEENANFTVGHNFMSTWTHAEYKRLLGYKQGSLLTAENTVELSEVDTPASVDWRTQGAVNPVKNQAQCGSCWAFSATFANEGAHFLKSGELLSLSEQELVSCDPNSMGCNGGLQAYAFMYLEQHGQNLESAYPYTSGHGVTGTCNHAKATGPVSDTGYTNIPAQSISQLKAALAKQPVALTIEADQLVFQMYTHGILDSASCGTQLDHAVGGVGYGTENGQDYWIVRNSWGSSWGDQGYIKIAAVPGKGICGVQMQNLYPSTN